MRISAVGVRPRFGPGFSCSRRPRNPARTRCPDRAPRRRQWRPRGAGASRHHDRNEGQRPPGQQGQLRPDADPARHRPRHGLLRLGRGPARCRHQHDLCCEVSCGRLSRRRRRYEPRRALLSARLLRRGESQGLFAVSDRERSLCSGGGRAHGDGRSCRGSFTQPPLPARGRACCICAEGSGSRPLRWSSRPTSRRKMLWCRLRHPAPSDTRAKLPWRTTMASYRTR